MVPRAGLPPAFLRRLNGTQEVGCSSALGGNVGVVAYLEQESDLAILSGCLLRRARATGQEAGVVLPSVIEGNWTTLVQLLLPSPDPAARPSVGGLAQDTGDTLQLPGSPGTARPPPSIPAVVAAAPVVAQVKAEVVKKQVTESFLVQPTNQGTSQEYTEVVTWMVELEGQTQAVLAMYSLRDIQEGEVLS